MNTHSPRRPLAVPADEGQALWWFAIGQPAASRTLPTRPAPPMDPERLLAIGREHGMEPVEVA